MTLAPAAAPVLLLRPPERRGRGHVLSADLLVGDDRLELRAYVSPETSARAARLLMRADELLHRVDGAVHRLLDESGWSRVAAAGVAPAALATARAVASSEHVRPSTEHELAAKTYRALSGHLGHRDRILASEAAAELSSRAASGAEAARRALYLVELCRGLAAGEIAPSHSEDALRCCRHLPLESDERSPSRTTRGRAGSDDAAEHLARASGYALSYRGYGNLFGRTSASECQTRLRAIARGWQS